MENGRPFKLKEDRLLVNESGEVAFRFRHEVLEIATEFVKEEDLDLRWLAADGSDPAIVPLTIAPVLEVGATIVRHPQTGQRIRYQHRYFEHPLGERPEAGSVIQFELFNSLANTSFYYDGQGQLTAVIKSNEQAQTTGCVFYREGRIVGGQLLIGPFSPDRDEALTILYDENLREKRRIERQPSATEKGILEVVSKAAGEEPRVIWKRPARPAG